MNLFQRLPYASEVVFRWMADDREYFQLCGFLLMARLLMKGQKLNERAEAEFLDQAFTALEGDIVSVQKAAALALCKCALQSKDNARKMSKPLQALLKSEKENVRLLAGEIRLEIEYL